MPSPRKPASNPVETEAKIRVASFTAIRRGILTHRGRLISVRALETNTLFDSANGALRGAGKSFRVRRYGVSGAVTLKGPVQVTGGLKSRTELETSVGSPETLAQILGGLGFVPTFRYQKYREIWTLGASVICLDETPIGRFVEIEGTSAVIHQVAARLGLSSDDFMSASYPALWFEAGRSGDMVFADRKRTKAAPKKSKKVRA